MSIARTCPTCQTDLPADAPAGLCPQCLLRLAAADEVERTSSLPSPAGGGFTAPSLAEMAARFPQFEVLELLGRGGMGAVYKARQIGLDRLVAVKVLPPEVGGAPFARRFFQEARALAALDHPNIIRVYDVGQADGLYYFFMEYVDGINLREAIRTGSLTSRDALAVVGQICDALQYAHDHGVVHRDIKPENILLDKRGRVKIADFGLAKLLRQNEIDPSLTGTHQVMGTPRYMAPEQLEGTKSVDHRADIYSLGVVFYELLTGELPLGRFAPPSKKADIDARLDEVVLRTLEKEPAERYQRASEVKTDVEAISHLSPPAPLEALADVPPVMLLPAAPASWSVVRVPLMALAAVMVLFLAAMAALYLSPAGPTLTDEVEVTAAPKSNDYEALRMRMTFVHPRMFGDAEAIKPQNLDLYFERDTHSHDRPATRHVLRVDLKQRSARWQEVGAQNALVLDHFSSGDLVAALNRSLGPHHDPSSRERECDALIKLINSVVASRPSNLQELSARARNSLGKEFEVTQWTLLSRLVTGVREEVLAGILVAGGALFVILAAMWLWAGRSIVDRGSKPALRAQAEARMLATALQWLGALSLLSIVVVLPVMLAFEDHGARTDWLEVLVPLVGGWLMLGGLFMTIAGFRAKTSTTAAWSGSALALFPLSPLAPLAIPVGAWGLWLLSRGDVAQAIDRERAERAAAEWDREQRLSRSRDDSFMYQTGSLVGMAARSRRLPGAMAIVAATVGALSVMMPWMLVQVTERGGAPAAPALRIAGFAQGPGLAASAVFLVVALLVFATGSLRWLAWVRVVLLTIGGVMTLSMLMGYATVVAASSTRDFPPHLDVVATLTPLYGFYLAIGCGITLLVAAAWQLRRVLEERGQG